MSNNIKTGVTTDILGKDIDGNGTLEFDIFEAIDDSYGTFISDGNNPDAYNYKSIIENPAYFFYVVSQATSAPRYKYILNYLIAHGKYSDEYSDKKELKEDLKNLYTFVEEKGELIKKINIKKFSKDDYKKAKEKKDKNPKAFAEAFFKELSRYTQEMFDAACEGNDYRGIFNIKSAWGVVFEQLLLEDDEELIFSFVLAFKMNVDEANEFISKTCQRHSINFLKKNEILLYIVLKAKNKVQFSISKYKELAELYESTIPFDITEDETYSKLKGLVDNMSTDDMDNIEEIGKEFNEIVGIQLDKKDSLKDMVVLYYVSELIDKALAIYKCENKEDKKLNDAIGKTIIKLGDCKKIISKKNLLNTEAIKSKSVDAFSEDDINEILAGKLNDSLNKLFSELEIKLIKKFILRKNKEAYDQYMDNLQNFRMYLDKKEDKEFKLTISQVLNEIYGESKNLIFDNKKNYLDNYYVEYEDEDGKVVELEVGEKNFLNSEDFYNSQIRDTTGGKLFGDLNEKAARNAVLTMVFLNSANGVDSFRDSDLDMADDVSEDRKGIIKDFIVDATNKMHNAGLAFSIHNPYDRFLTVLFGCSKPMSLYKDIWNEKYHVLILKYNVKNNLGKECDIRLYKDDKLLYGWKTEPGEHNFRLPMFHGNMKLCVNGDKKLSKEFKFDSNAARFTWKKDEENYVRLEREATDISLAVSESGLQMKIFAKH